MKGWKAVSVSSECVRTADVKPHPGVTRRPGTNRYQFQLQTPTDLKHLIRSEPEDLVETAEKVRPEGLELPMVFHRWAGQFSPAWLASSRPGSGAPRKRTDPGEDVLNSHRLQ